MVRVVVIFVFISMVFMVFMVIDIINGRRLFFLVKICLMVFKVVLICSIFW